MNLTIEGTLQGGLRRARLEYVSLVAGLALAVAAALTMAGWPSTSGGAITHRNLADAASRAPWQPESYVYIVGSVPDAELLRNALADAGLTATASTRFEIVILETPQDERALDEGMYAGVNLGSAPDVQFLDLRSR